MLAAGMMIWLGAAGDRLRDSFSFTGQQKDYYNLLVDGFLEGQLHLKAAVHPDRLNPDIEVRKRAPYLLDAAFYHGRYYLYYGVVPAVMVLLPYSLLTGHDLSLNVATTGYVLLGFGLTVAWYLHLRRKHYATVPDFIDSTVVLLLAFGPATTFLIRRSMFYELPLAAGYACLCGFIWAATKALDAPHRGGRWITIASLCVGLAAGCHPNYAFLTILVAVAAWWTYRGLPQRTPADARRFAVAAVLPATLIGAALASYNYARFGNPLEFGFNYGVNVFFETKDQLMSAAFLWPNFKWYYLTPPTLLPYFPFVFPADTTFRPDGYHGAEAIHGQFWVAVLVAWICLGVARFQRELDWPATVRRMGTISASAGIISALFILLLGIRANRYMVDFQLPLIALCVLAIGKLGELPARNRMIKVWRGGVAALAVLGSVNSLLAAIQQFDDFQNTRSETFRFLSRTLNPSWAFWHKLNLVKTGTLEFAVSFKAQARPVGEPLLTLGVPGYSDCVYAIQHPGNHLEFLVDHLGYGGPRSRIFSYEPGKTYIMQIELGGFYPPKSDPFFARVPSGVIHRIKTTAKVTFDGQTAIDENMAFYEAAPWQRDLGSNKISATGYSERFSGQIGRRRWLAPAPLPTTETAIHHPCCVRLELVFPDHRPATNQPLISFGVPGAGTLVYLQPSSSDEWMLGLDEWGHALPPALPVLIAPGPHVVDLFIGPLLADDPVATDANLAGNLTTRQRLLVLWLDGRKIGSFPLSDHLSSFANPTIGANIQGFSTSEAYFYGHIKNLELSPVEREKLLRIMVTPETN